MTPRFAIALGAMGLALWPVWPWYARATLDGSNDPAGLLAAATAAAVVWRAPARAPVAWPLLAPALLLMLYALMTAAGLPPAAGAMVAAFALCALASAWRLGRRMDLALLSLVLLALPLSATLQFYAGYPLRVLAGTLSAAMLRMGGLPVVREGAMLAWDGQLVAIDAPCSGVKMLWAGMYLAAALSASYRLPALRTVGAMAIALAVVVLANAMRAASLFYTETGIVQLPGWTHAGTGVVCFIAGALCILMGTRAMEGART